MATLEKIAIDYQALVLFRVGYHIELSNFYASYARLLRGVRFFEKAGYHFTLTDDV
jgi:hypothetical protein